MLTDEILDSLLKRYVPPGDPSCHICDKPMKLIKTREYDATWACENNEVDHFSHSRIAVFRTGDADIITLIEEFRQVRDDKKRLNDLELIIKELGYYPTSGYLVHEDGSIPESNDPHIYIVDPVEDEGSSNYWIGKGRTLRECLDDAQHYIETTGKPTCRECGEQLAEQGEVCDSCLEKGA